MPGYRLSKSRFVAGWQCHKYLWWLVHEPDAPELVFNESQRATLDRGIHVGEVAQGYVPGGVLIDFPHKEIERRVEATAEAIRNGAPIVYEASFVSGDVYVAVDIMEKTSGGWNLIEVKSSTKAKDEHVPDVAVQAHTLQSSGIKVKGIYLMHLSRECCFPNLDELFNRTDLTSEANALLPSVREEVVRQIKMLNGPLPEINRGPYCKDPRECPFHGRCWADVPESHISTLYRTGLKKASELESEGILTILDLPTGYRLSAVAERQKQSVLSGEMIVDSGLRHALDEILPPLAYLDFETVRPAIPVWDGCRPYDQIPVQFSCHVQKEDGTVEHHDWLADGPGDPREDLARRLIEVCREAKTILTYHLPFERGCLEFLQRSLPHMAIPLQEMIAKLGDLLPVVRDHLYHPDFKGSFSIKSVLPALVPELSYQGLEVSDGDTASVRLERLLLSQETIPEEEQPSIRAALLQYCEMDTLAMVRLHERLLQVSR